MSDWQFLTTDHNTEIPVRWYLPDDRTADKIVIFWPALGIEARFYRRLAEGLAKNGIAVLLVEQRGHGKSPYRPGRGKDFSMADFIMVDMTTVVRHAHSRFPSAKIIMGGHSLGGHLSSMYAGLYPDQLDGLLHVAVALPFKKAYSGMQRYVISFIAVAVRLTTRLLGYYPGKYVGFGAKEYAGLMRDWRHWALRGDFDVTGLEGVTAAMQQCTQPTLQIIIDKDTYVSKAALDLSVSGFHASAVTSITVGEAEQGNYLGHVNWGRRPDGVVTKITDWVNRI